MASSTIEYEFQVNTNREVKVVHYDYNSEKEMILNLGKLEDPVEGLVELRIEFESRKFSFFVDGEEMGRGNLNSESWQDIRFFTSSMSIIEVDRLIIENI